MHKTTTMTFILIISGSDGDASNEGGDDDDDDEVDPLEAFMAEVDATEEVVPQQSVYGIASQQAERAPPPTLSAANTISLDDLMRMSSAPSTTEGEGWESDTTASEMEEEVDEEQQERDRIEFMKAIRGLHGAPVAASTGAAAEPTKSSTLQEDKESTTPRVTTSSAAAEDEAETPVPAKEATKREKQQLGRMFGDEGDVMEEHEREVLWLLVCYYYHADKSLLLFECFNRSRRYSLSLMFLISFCRFAISYRGRSGLPWKCCRRRSKRKS